MAVLAAIVMAFYQNSLVGIRLSGGAPIGMIALVVLAFKYWPKTAMGKRVLLMAPTGKDVLPDDPEKDRLKSLIGRTGRAKSKLLLSGVITIDGSTVNAVSESMPVEVGQAVRVVQVRGLRAVVRPIDEESAAPPPVDPLERTYDDPFELPRLDKGVRGEDAS